MYPYLRIEIWGTRLCSSVSKIRQRESLMEAIAGTDATSIGMDIKADFSAPPFAKSANGFGRNDRIAVGS